MRAFLLLVALLSVSQSAVAQPDEPVTTVTVTLSSFSFAPPSFTLHHGRHYRLHLVNTSSGGHDFNAKSFFAASTIAADDVPKISDGKVELRGGQSVYIAVTPNVTGRFKFHCSHFMHKPFGMKGEIVVD